MGHRHLYNTSQMFEGDHDQTWNHMNADQPYLARAGVAENVSLIYPVENMTIDGGHYSSHWNPPPRPNVYSSSGHNVEVPHYQQDALGPSRDPFLHLPAAGTFPMGPENYAHHASSSNYDRQTFHGMDNGFVDLTMGNGRGPYKRKSPGIPSVFERGSTSRFYSAGSSSDLSVSADLRQEKPNADSQNMPWDHINMSPGYRGSGLSIGGEGSLRNVRSRSALDLESNLARTHLSGNPSRHSYSASHPMDYSSSVDLSSQSSNSSSREWNHILSPAHGRTPVSDTSGLSHETNHFPLGSCTTNAPVEFGGYNHDFIPSRNPIVPQSLHGTSNQSVRGVRTSYSQRSTPTSRASSSNSRLGHPTTDEGLQLVAENYSSRHSRPFSTVGWRNSDRNGRSRISNERFRSLSDEAGVRERLASEGLMIVDRSALYGSRNLFDQHREMRLDVDNMSYEELLALGERIGNVNTGLSEDMMSKCLTETIYCSSDQLQEEGACVICLDEYKNMDDVGTLSACRHDYHVDCIKKWLLMKNSCPICKAPALPDHMKGI
ncbi:hypothetical protein AAG906_014514 [Vitis piasezkii]|uniref:RING-type E3 ubiquitin transferase n=1 Tax=Vitis vinifera TaxID=29760 RepID=D7TQJ0_VITVI|eukprot:XP_010653546.1 PREDICTED: probable E3 ubiquitin-protein ligase HIP1 [Vitis vinifera]